MKEEPKTIVVIDDTLWRSLVKDFYTCFSLLGVIGIGWWIDSSALQWFGGLVWIVLMLAIVAQRNRLHTMTIAKAREFLNSIEEDTFFDPR